MDTKQNKRYSLYIAVLCLLLILVNAISLTFAYFTDKKSGSSILTFGNVDIDATFKNDSGQKYDSFTFASSDVMTGEKIERKVNIKNVDDSDTCVVRMYIKFELNLTGTYEDVTSSKYILLSVNGTGWTENTSINYFYYNNTLDTSEDVDVNLVMTIQDNFGQDAITGDLSQVKYRITLYVNAVQYANNAYSTDWAGEMPSGWTPAE